MSLFLCSFDSTYQQSCVFCKNACTGLWPWVLEAGRPDHGSEDAAKAKVLTRSFLPRQLVLALLKMFLNCAAPIFSQK